MENISLFAVLINLILTAILYAIFPVIFASARKKQITKRKYTWICYGANFGIMFAVKLCLELIGGDFGSLAPYVLWTYIFSRVGMKYLRESKLLPEQQSGTSESK